MTTTIDNLYRQKYLSELASVKTPGTTDKCSAEEFQWRINEIAKCKRSIQYFAENWFKIINLDKGLMTIKLYPKQHELLEFFKNEKRCIVCASRQSSKTTTYTIYLLWLCNFHPEKKVMLLANKADTALEILSRVRLAYEYLPSFLKASVLTWNKGEIVFSNMSSIKGFATASDAARGYSCNCIDKNTYITVRFFGCNFLKFRLKIKYLYLISRGLNFLSTKLISHFKG